MRYYSALLLLILMLAGCAKPKALVYQELTDVQLQNVSLQSMTVVLDLKFYNPNNYAISLKNGDLEAYVNDKYIGKATLDERTAIPPHNTFILPVTVTASMGSMLLNALRMLRHNNESVPVRLQGSIKAGRNGIYFPVNVNYSGSQKINL